jgi:O-antigen/teichoic acid export membrane protein
VLTFSLPLVALALLTALNNFTDRFFLTHLHGLNEVAIYSAAYSLAAIASFFYSVLGFTLFPVLSRRWAEGSLEETGQLVSRVMLVYLFFLMPFIAGLTVVGPSLMRLLATDAYETPAYLLLTLGCGIGLFGLYQIAFYVTLLGHGSVRALPLMGVAAGANVLLNAMLVPRYGGFGAALAGCASNAVLALQTLRLARQILPWRFPWSAGLRILLRTLCMAAFLWLAGIWPGYGDFHSLLAVLFSAALLYLVLDRVDRRNSILSLLKPS